MLWFFNSLPFILLSFFLVLHVWRSPSEDIYRFRLLSISLFRAITERGTVFFNGEFICLIIIIDFYGGWF